MSVTVALSRGTSLEALLNDRVGYGANVTGGSGGTVSHVTTLNDSGAGSLRSFCEDTTTRWIRFSVSGTINLSSVIFMRSNKTIDGRNASIVIDSNGLFFGRAVGPTGTAMSNAIITNIAFTGSIT